MQGEFIDIVIFLSMDWKSCGKNSIGNFGDAPIIRKLSKLPGVRILCVNQPFTPVETTLRKKPKAIQWIKGKRLERLEDKLFLYTPFAFVHEMLTIYSPVLRKMNAAVLSRQINRQLRALGFDSPLRLSWIYHPLQHSYFGLASESFKIYKCWDLYKSRNYTDRMKQAIEFYEEKIISECDAILTPCISLYNELSLLTSKTFFTPAGVNFEGQMKSLMEPVDEGMKNLPRPIIGFAGIISRRVDLSLISFLAESHPEWSIVMLGKTVGGREFLNGRDYRKCQELKNVHFPGFREFDELPLYINCFDVCLLPHSDVEVMRYSHPYKILQYLSAGKPVVSTDYPDAHCYKDVIKIAGSREEFVSLVEEALENGSEDSAKKRIDFARKNTWDIRAEETHNIFLNIIKSKA